MIYREVVLLLALATTRATTSSLPYNPPQLILTNNSHQYIINSNSGKTTLLTFDISQSLETDKFQAQTLAEVPFSINVEAVNTIQNADGSVVVLGGSCSRGDNVQAWTFKTDPQSSIGNGSWTQQMLSGSNGVEYLSGSMSFAGQNNAMNSSLYTIGGMCPKGNASASTWTTDATYSSAVAELLSNSNQQYTQSAISSTGGPVAEAGFTITPLPAAGYTTGALQQQFVLIGGHTQTAFINMSQAAVFSLPQASWSFVPLLQPGSSHGDLALRDTQVEPRSGHTAVLTQDGKRLVVFGGWVGDVDTPAQPQIVLLEVGLGSSQWQWIIPSTSGASSAGTGIYGHAAAMLSGDVMMVYGGYQIASSLRKRVDISQQIMLYNVSSNQWITTYNTQSSTTSPSEGSSPRIGLAVGLTVGVLLLLCLIGVYVWYTRRARRKYQEAERGLETRSSDDTCDHIDQPFLEKNSIDGRGGDIAALNPNWLAQPAQHSATTGLFVNMPSPTRGLRKGVLPRNHQYHAAPRYDEKRASRHSGNIHPIVELDDEDLQSIHAAADEADMTEAQRQLKEVERILQCSRKPVQPLNPLRSHPVSPEVGESSRNIIVAKRARSPTKGIDDGRVSPSKTEERTLSTLSTISHRSVLSDNSITRTMSTRTGALLSAAAAAHVRAKAVEAETSSSSDARTSTMSTEGRSNTMSTTGRISPVSRKGVTRSSTSGSEAKSAGIYAESFRTARSHPHNDRDALLDDYSYDYDDPYRRAAAVGGARVPVPPTRRRQGILGSLRKAIGDAMAAGERTMSMASNRGHEQLPSTNSSPTKEHRNPLEGPRRTVSDGGALLRQKRGRLDWTDAPYSDGHDPGDWGAPIRTSTEKQQAEEDWDVEDAAAKRDVQIMFTIPKSRLRVVNADMDRASLRSVSDGALSRAGSVRVPRHEMAFRGEDIAEGVKLSVMLENEIDEKDKVL